jgi:hypothetical protein
MSEIEFLKAWFAEFGAEPVKIEALYKLAESAGISDAVLGEKSKQSAIGRYLKKMLDVGYEGEDSYIYTVKKITKYRPTLWRVMRTTAAGVAAKNLKQESFIGKNEQKYIRITVDCLESQAQRVLDLFAEMNLQISISAK